MKIKGHSVPGWVLFFAKTFRSFVPYISSKARRNNIH